MRHTSPGRRHLILLALWLVLSPLAAPSPVAAATGELRLAGPVGGLDALDPATTRDLATSSVLRQIFRGLVAFDDALRPVPELAGEIEVSPDGLVYDFTLRDDVRFHDGSAIEAQDVVFSLTRAVSPGTAGGDVGQLGGPTFLSGIRGYGDVVSGSSSTLEGVTAIDALRVRIELAGPQSTFLMRLASVPASILDQDQVMSDDDWSSRPNGSGPFRVDRFTVDDELILEAYDGYFSGSPKAARVAYRLGTNALQSYNLFQADEIDLDSVSPLNLSAVQAQLEELDAEIVRADAFSLTYIGLRGDQPPLDDIHIRRAVQLAFPRELIAAIALDGEVPAARGIVPPGMLERDWPAELLAFDLEAAREEIRLSRYGQAESVPPIRLDIAGSYAAEAFQEAVETGLGIDIEIVDHDGPTYFDGLARGAYPAHELTWGADFPDPATFLTSLFGGTSADNYIGYANPEVDRLLTQADATLDAGARAALYVQAQQLIVDDAVVIPLYHDVQYTLVRRGVTGVVATPMGILRLETISVER